VWNRPSVGTFGHHCCRLQGVTRHLHSSEFTGRSLRSSQASIWGGETSLSDPPRRGHRYKHARLPKMTIFLNCLFISRRRFLWQHSTSSSEHWTDTHRTPRRRCVRTVNTCEVLLWTSLGRQGPWLQLRPRSFGFWVYGRLQGQFVSVNRRSRPSRGPIPSTKPAWS